MNRMLHVSIPALLLIGLLLSGNTSYAANIAVDFSKTFQTIDGFGGAQDMNPYGTPKYTDDWIDLLVDNLGLTIVRTPQQNTESEAPYIQAMIDKGRATGIPIKVFTSLWSAPAQFKSNNSEIGGSLDMTKVGDFADWMVNSVIKPFKTRFGVDLYGISPQNEPQIEEWYISCRYEPEDLAQVVIALSQRVYDQGLSTKVMFSDDLFGFNTYNYAIQREVAQDPKADSVASIFCMHYGNGSLNASATYRAYGGQAMPKGKAAWNSEFGNGSDTWDQSWENSRAICLMLKYGYSAVVYWLLGPHASNAGESVMFNHTPGPKAWGIKAFARYIRPGAVRVDCASDDADVWCIAFAHGGQRTVTLVIMNTASSDRQVTLGGAGLPAQFNVIRTGNGYNCVATGTVRTGETFTAPPQNILTLQTTGVDMTAVSRMSFSSMSGATIRMQPGRTALFSLDGRRVSRTVSTNRAGVLIRTAGKSVAERTASIR